MNAPGTTATDSNPQAVRRNVTTACVGAFRANDLTPATHHQRHLKGH